MDTRKNNLWREKSTPTNNSPKTKWVTKPVAQASVAPKTLDKQLEVTQITADTKAAIVSQIIDQSPRRKKEKKPFSSPRMKSVKSSKTNAPLMSFEEFLKLNEEIKIEEASDLIPESKFTGKDAENYEQFYQYARSKLTLPLSSFEKLGVVDNDKHFFKPDGFVKGIAAGFLKRFWEQSLYYSETIAYQKLRYNNFGSTKNISPACIGFHVVRIKNEKFIVVSLSGGQGADKIRNLLKDFIAKSNGKLKAKSGQKKILPFIFVDGELDNYQTLIALAKNTLGNVQEEPSSNICAELYFGSFFLNNYLTHGNDFFVENSVYGDFYPYRVGKSYGDQINDSIDRTVKPPIWGDVLDLKNKLFVPIKPCCDACLKRKPTELSLFSLAQQYGTLTKAEKEDAKEQTILTPAAPKSFSSSIFKNARRVDSENNMELREPTARLG